MVMKSFFMAIIFMMLIKGFTCIIASDWVKSYSQILVGTPNMQLVLFGWILVITAAIFYFSYVRYLTW